MCTFSDYTSGHKLTASFDLRKLDTVYFVGRMLEYCQKDVLTVYALTHSRGFAAKKSTYQIKLQYTALGITLVSAFVTVRNYAVPAKLGNFNMHRMRPVENTCCTESRLIVKTLLPYVRQERINTYPV